MRVVLVNLSDKLFEESRFRLNTSAKRFGITDIRSQDFEEIKGTSFFAENKEILSQPVGSGYWLWKPYLIAETMKTLDEGDIVIYSDAGIEIIDPIEPLLRICSEEQPILLFGNGNHVNSMWTKRDCFVLMDCDNDQCWKGPHCDASFSLFRKTALSERFVGDWLQYGRDKRIITDLPNTSGKRNLRDFIQHRRDQSILSLLAWKYGLPLYRMPSQFGNHYKTHPYRLAKECNCINQINTAQVNYYATIPYYNSPYFQLLDHHRTKKDNSGPTSLWQKIKIKIARKIKRTVWIIRNGRSQ